MTTPIGGPPLPPPTSNPARDLLLRGRIKRIDRNFGFIIDEAGQERFFHCSEVVGGRAKFESLVEGCEVDFIPWTNDRGPRATGIKVRG